jgi:hypothetical protein
MLPGWSPSGREWLLAHYFPGMEAGRVQRLPQSENWKGAIVTGDVTRDFLIGAGWDPNNILLLYPGLPPLSESSSNGRSGLHCAWVGNLIPGKGIRTFLEALIPYRSSLWELGVQIHLAGSDHLDPEYALSCRELLRVLQPLVRYRGALTAPGMQQLYQESDLFLTTSGFETFGMAILEARATGLPVVGLSGGLGVHAASLSQTFATGTDMIRFLLHLAKNPHHLHRLQLLAQEEADQLVDTFPSWDTQARRLADFLTIR